MSTIYTQEVIGDLDVIDTYKKLMEASTGQNSAYIRAKETLQDIIDSGDLFGADKAAMVAQTITSIATNITNSALNAAIEIAKENRDSKYTLTKLKEDTRLVTAKVEETEANTENAVLSKDLAIMGGWKVQAELYRDYGINSYDLAALPTVVPYTAYTDYGVKVETLKKAKADTFTTYSNTFRTSGNVNYTVDPATGQFTSINPDNTGLTYAQEQVAVRQRQGFDDNQRQHVANSSASMIGLLLGTEASGINYDPYLASWSTAVDYLNSSHSSITPVTGSVDILIEGTISVSSGHTLSGTVTGISAGRSVAITYTADGQDTVQGTPGLVLFDGTWESILLDNKSSDLVSGIEYTVTASIADHTGTIVKDVFTQVVSA